MYSAADHSLTPVHEAHFPRWKPHHIPALHLESRDILEAHKAYYSVNIATHVVC